MSISGKNSAVDGGEVHYRPIPAVQNLCSLKWKLLNLPGSHSTLGERVDLMNNL